MQSRREVLGGLLTIGFIPACACAQSESFGCVVSDHNVDEWQNVGLAPIPGPRRSLPVPPLT